MPSNRYYIETPFETEQQLSVQGEEAHHMRVMRTQIKDRVELVNGKGELAHALVERIDKKEIEVFIEEVLHIPPPPTLILALGLPLMNHLEWVIEKGTELGASAFWIFPGMRSEKKSLSAPQLHRLKNVSVAALKQSGSLYLPYIEVKPPLLKWKRLDGSLFFGDTSKDASYLPKNISSPLIFFVGPEKGFHPQEEAFLRQTLYATGVKLHSNILRAETAALTALSQLYLIINYF